MRASRTMKPRGPNSSFETPRKTRGSQDEGWRRLASDDDADHVRRRQIFFLDLRARRRPVFRGQ